VARTVTAGGAIKLRIQFKDDLGKPTEAQNVLLHIFDASAANTTDNANAVDPAGFTPTFLGEGVYEYEYTTPCTPVGDWTEKWTGDLTCQSGLSTTLTFSVVVGTSEVVTFEGPQLFNNNLVSIKILPGIKTTDGDALEEEIEIEFFTKLTPFYTSASKVKLEVGSLVNEIKDLTSAMAILDASLEADSLNFTTTKINNNLFQHARREYVTASSAFKLVSNVGGNLLKSKTLGDLSVTYDTTSHRETLEHLRSMMEKWGEQLMAGGGAKAATNPRMVVKGSLDPDKPIPGRLWQSTASNNKYPVANDREESITRRRTLRTHKKRWW